MLNFKISNIISNKHGSQLLAASTSSSILTRLGYDKAFLEYLRVSIAFLYVARVQPWLIIHANITILPADKGGVTIIMDKAGYKEKALHKLSDTQTYSVLITNPTPKLTRTIQKTLD